MIDTEGTCRFRHFSDIQEQVIKRLGYDVQIFPLKRNNFFGSLQKVSGQSKIELVRHFKTVFDECRKVEEEQFKFEPKKINIGVIGETFTIFEPAVNNNIISKLKKNGCGVDVRFKMTDFLSKYRFEKMILEREARKYLKEDIGGHARESISNMIYFGKKKYNGVIHISPLTCMPEVTVEPILEMISKDYDIPMYKFRMDENNSMQLFNTRLETFIEVIKHETRN